MHIPIINPINMPTAKDQDPEHQRLRKATHDMEAYFVGVLLKKLRETTDKAKLLPEDSSASTYREMFDDALAAEIGKRGAFGIADMLYKELVVHLDGPNHASKQRETPGTSSGSPQSAETAAKPRP
jgi:Rod binding domain-containing protein